MKEMGLDAARRRRTQEFIVMGKAFDPAKPDDVRRRASRSSGPERDGGARRTRSACGPALLSLLDAASCCRSAIWHVGHHAGGRQPAGAVDAGVRQADGRAAATGASRRCRRPRESARRSWKHVADPFYESGPNDKGIGIQLAYSLARVLLGFVLAALVAIPLGFLIGMSPLVYRALDPFIQVLKPISPLAWMPLALYTIKDRRISSIFVIFICSVWPMLINTAFGVASVRARMAERRAHARGRPVAHAPSRVILPAAAPTIMTGMRISIGIAWLVIVAAEMLVGGTGIGYFVWNEWNNLSIANIVTAILLIGVVGHAARPGARAAHQARDLPGMRPQWIVRLNALISVEGLARRFGDRHQPAVFENIWFGIDRGEFVCLIGHSGCGKTTILNVLAGLDQPSDGAVIVDSREIDGPSLDRAVIFQGHALMPWLTVMGNIAFAVSSRWPSWDRAQGAGPCPQVHRAGGAEAAPRTSGRRSSPAA